MNCDQACELLDGFIDDELPPAEHQRVASHLEDCPDCAALQARVMRQCSLLREVAGYHAPPGLSGQIKLQLDEVPNGTFVSVSKMPWRRWRWRIAAPLVAAGVAAALVALLLVPVVHREDVVQEVVAAHVRSLLMDNLLHVASADNHTVKPWFHGQLDYAPPVQNLSDEGFPLQGGRLDYVGQRPVAAIVYRRRQHAVNYFVWPTRAADLAPEAFSRQGYHIVHTVVSGLDYWLVSDLRLDELQSLARMLSPQSKP